MKKAFILLIIIFTCLPCLAQTFNATIEKNWTLDSAKEEAFYGIQFYKDFRGFPSTDPFYFENKTAILNTKSSTFKYKNRSITSFYSYPSKEFIAYCVNEDNSYITFYFDKLGNLIMLQYSENKDFPFKSYKYEYPAGKLRTVSVNLKNDESYIFRYSGELVAHCIKSKCYNDMGKVIILRENF